MGWRAAAGLLYYKAYFRLDIPLKMRYVTGTDQTYEVFTRYVVYSNHIGEDCIYLCGVFAAIEVHSLAIEFP